MRRRKKNYDPTTMNGLVRFDDRFTQSDLSRAMLACWRASNLPLTNKVVIDRAHLNCLIDFAERWLREVNEA